MNMGRRKELLGKERTVLLRLADCRSHRDDWQKLIDEREVELRALRRQMLELETEAA